jgi:hypothetical protein
MPVEEKQIWGIPDTHGAESIINSNGELLKVKKIPGGTEGAVRGWVPHWKVCGDIMAARRTREEIAAAIAAREEAKRAEAAKPKQLTMFGG